MVLQSLEPKITPHLLDGLPTKLLGSNVKLWAKACTKIIQGNNVNILNFTSA